MCASPSQNDVSQRGGSNEKKINSSYLQHFAVSRKEVNARVENRRLS